MRYGFVWYDGYGLILITVKHNLSVELTFLRQETQH
jgi:hypothetical protein